MRLLFFIDVSEFRSAKPGLAIEFVLQLQLKCILNQNWLEYNVTRPPALPDLPLPPTSVAAWLWNHLFEIVYSVHNCLLDNDLRGGKNKDEQNDITWGYLGNKKMQYSIDTATRRQNPDHNLEL